MQAKSSHLVVAARAVDQNGSEVVPQADVLKLPMLAAGQRLEVSRIRDEQENFYLAFIWVANVVALLTLIVIGYFDIQVLAVILASSVSSAP